MNQDYIYFTVYEDDYSKLMTKVANVAGSAIAYGYPHCVGTVIDEGNHIVFGKEPVELDEDTMWAIINAEEDEEEGA